MKRKITFMLLLMGLLFSAFSQNASDLFISEYCEYNQTIASPNYFNHYIEIYNGTGKAVDMSKYQLWRSLNATGWNVNTGNVVVVPLTLNGVLENNKTYVITRPNTNTAPISIAVDSAQSWFFLNISGDDAVGLAKDTGGGHFVLIDIVGSETVDPGEGWTVAGIALATQNHTLVRKPNVCSPSLNWANACGTNADDAEWIVKAQNDISDINKHTCNCNGIVVDTTVKDTTDTVIPVNTRHYKYTSFFIGNSYTYYNDLPALIDNIARTTGDTLVHAQSTPGGYFLDQHSVLVATLSGLKAKAYDFVVIQEQSQRPALDSLTSAYKFFKYAAFFDSMRRVYSPNGQSMLYMTWGRKNGDDANCATNPNVCTYEGMDSMLRLRYREAQQQLGSLIAPVGAVRNYLRKNHPGIELYISDNSHPTPEGSFVSAITFYTCMFRKDPTLTTYNFSIGDSVATIIRKAAKTVVFDTLSYWNTYAAGVDTSVSLEISSPTAKDTIYVGEAFKIKTNIISKDTISEVLVYLNGVLINSSPAQPFEYTVSSNVKGKNSIIVTVKTVNGGIISKRIDITVKTRIITSVKVDDNNMFNIYPNPATTSLTIELVDRSSVATYEIYQINGQILKNGSINGAKYEISLEGMRPGMYSVQVASENGKYTEKFIKK